MTTAAPLPRVRKGGKTAYIAKPGLGSALKGPEPVETIEDILARTIRWANSNARVLGVVAHREVLARLTMELERARAKEMEPK